MQHCDATCGWCARHFWTWLKARMKSHERESGRSGAGSFADAAASSNIPSEDATPTEPRYLEFRRK